MTVYPSFFGCFSGAFFRRLPLFAVLALLLTSLNPAQAQEQTQQKPQSQSQEQAQATTEPQREEKDDAFSPEMVLQYAQNLAVRPYENPEGKVPAALLALSPDEWLRLHFMPEEALWRNEGLGFGVRFFAPGALYNRMIRVHVVEEGQSTELAFRPEMFDVGNSSPEVAEALVSSGFAGFAVTFPFYSLNSEDEIIQFLGASFIRAIARNADLGVQARGLAVNTALPEGEEIPWFREFWFMKPAPGDQTLTIHALLDSPSLTGAFRFVLKPGTSLVMDVECTLFPRLDTGTPQKIGIAPLGAMFLSSESKGIFPGDYRPEVHDADGLLLANAEGNWLWRPLTNGERLSIHGFEAPHPKGFGLIQRDNNFDHYQDIYGRFERRASAWVEPLGDWGPGHIELIEIPTRSDLHNNITAFWVADPDPSLAFSPSRFAWRIYWMTPGVSPHALGKAAATRLTVMEDGAIRFMIDFEGEAMSAIPAQTGLTSVVDLDGGGQLLEKYLLKNPVTGGWRLILLVRMPSHDGMVQTILSARDGGNSVRLRALLRLGENIPEPLTETWVYDYTL